MHQLLFIAELDSSSSIIAFTAYSTESINYSAGQHYLYNGMIVNNGNHFQPTSSYFICPDDQLYFFSIDIMSDSDANVHGTIMIEDTLLVMAYAGKTTHETETSALAISRCARGKKVWVREYGGGVVFSNGNRHVSFTGFRLN